MTFVGLLRGINVGNSVKVSMKNLKNLVEEAGGTEVVTYLNSGNVVFKSNLGIPELQQRMEQDLKQLCGHPIPILILSESTIVAVRNAIPKEWENSDTEQTYVAYLFPDIDKAGLIDELPVKHHLIEFKYVQSAIIWNIKRENYNKSQITKIVSHRSYDRMTTRNVNTARKLAELCERIE